MNNLKIGIDMDGVLADLDSAFLDFAERNHPGEKEKHLSPTDFFDKFLPYYSKQEGFFTQGKLEKADELVDFLTNLKGVDLFILTSAGHFHNPISDIVHQKKKWIEKEFPQLERIPFVATTSGSDKAIFANKNTILIDDHKSNVKRFTSKGGHGILYAPGRLNKVKENIKALIS